jgi:hypothetical protein
VQSESLEDAVDMILDSPYPRLRLFGLTEMDQIPALPARCEAVEGGLQRTDLPQTSVEAHAGTDSWHRLRVRRLSPLRSTSTASRTYSRMNWLHLEEILEIGETDDTAHVGIGSRFLQHSVWVAEKASLQKADHDIIVKRANEDHVLAVIRVAGHTPFAFLGKPRFQDDPCEARQATAAICSRCKLVCLLVDSVRSRFVDIGQQLGSKGK